MLPAELFVLQNTGVYEYQERSDLLKVIGHQQLASTTAGKVP